MPEAKTKEMGLEKMEGGGKRKAPGVQVEGGAGFREEEEEAARKIKGVIHWAPLETCQKVDRDHTRGDVIVGRDKNEIQLIRVQKDPLQWPARGLDLDPRLGTSLPGP